MTVVVTGGAGYIGSHAVRILRQAGYDVAVVDNLFRGHRRAVPDDVPFHHCDLADTQRLESILRTHHADAVMHFAALAYVGESVNDPLTYYRNNVGGTVSLLQAMGEAGVKKLVFSSTCATYGEPETFPMTEDLPQAPINPYGRSKLMVEDILWDLVHADPEFAVTAPRYFNVAGCASDGSIGEDHKPETHLIPLVLQVALGQRESITVFGDDYPTPDGTCIRDYIHVDDLCRAHVLALKHLRPGEFQFYNLGIGRGFSVREVIQSARRVTGRDILEVMGVRRAGDPPQLFADSSKIQRELGWKPEYTELDEIIRTAWRWMSEHPQGYGDR